MISSSARQPQGPHEPPTDRPRVAYLMSRFPKLTETFVLYEILALEQLAIDVDIYPLLGKHDANAQRAGVGLFTKLWEYLFGNSCATVVHAEAEELVQRAHYTPFFSWDILCANMWFLFCRPRVYCTALISLGRGTWGNLNRFLGGLSVFPKSVFFARRMMRSGVRHIHAHFANHPAAVANVIHRLSGIPYSFTAHGSDLHCNRYMLQEKVDDAAFVVTVSNYNRQVILEHCGQQASDKVLVIHCGVDTHVFRPTTCSTPFKDRNAPFSVFCIGTLHEVKGQTHLLSACRLLQQRGVEFVLNLVGDGPDANDLIGQAREAGIADRVVFHGRQSRDRVVELLRDADVVVAPSVLASDGRREGIPVVLMEGMACGVPVVASRLSGIPELVQDGESGLLVPPRDETALALALQSLYSDHRLRTRLGHAARERILCEFDLHANAARLADCFQSSCQQTSSRHASDLHPGPHSEEVLPCL